uniref:Transmembrane protein n=1 Tax=Grammatophora oceanica TaxID=210454 RepID=A0A7S1Y6L7_9STRA|mmetsp:Transcript_26286/g.38530  ORF Transcript_26286/g.38530 Transcript_26286/m.38530 type:complete len:147 (+) Transcript_26286:95-535(+)
MTMKKTIASKVGAAPFIGDRKQGRHPATTTTSLHPCQHLMKMNDMYADENGVFVEKRRTDMYLFILLVVAAFGVFLGSVCCLILLLLMDGEVGWVHFYTMIVRIYIYSTRAIAKENGTKASINPAKMSRKSKSKAAKRAFNISSAF